MNHLTDNQLQEILDGNIASNDPQMVHLDDCIQCREALAFYKTLGAELSQEIEVDLSADFADQVMTQLPPEIAPATTRPYPRFIIRDRMVVFAAFAAFLATAIYFLKPATLLKAFGGLKPAVDPSNSQWLSTISDYFSAWNINPVMVVMAALAIITIGVLDQIISRHRKQRGLISFLA
ncbi:MAG: hypothetical protein GY841_15055 [FCB group bacterium]|nr:hypothetical protein [FCB group bacterium]